MRIRRLLLSLTLVLPLLVATGNGAFADCVNPDRPEGAIVYNTDFNVPQYCNGNEWIAFGALNPAAGGGGCVSPDGPEGKLAYNTNYHVLQYCDGDDWRTVGSGRISGGGFLGFTDLVDQPLSTLLTSNILQVTIDGGSAPVSLSGDGSPQYRICSDDACGAEIQSWASSAGSVNSGDFLQLRLTSDASFGVTNSATVTVGVSSDQWNVAAAGQDTTPDGFSFTDQTNVAEATLIESNTVNITGINDTASVSISGDGSPEFRIDGGSWTSGPATITNGQSLQIRLTSGGFAETRLATVTVGTVDEEWSVSTSSQDTSPDAFNFTDQTAVALNSLISSNSVNITGITGSVSVSVSGSGGPEIRVNGGSWTAGPSTITNGQTLEVRLTSANADSTMRSATVTVGSGSNQWDVTTQDTTPNAFGFTDVIDQPLNTLVTSNSVAINGITGTVSVSVSGNGSPQIRVNGGSWTAGPTTITNAQTLEVRLTSSASLNTTRAATVTVGTGSNQWEVTTLTYYANAVHFDGANDDVSYTALSGVTDSKLVTLSFWARANDDSSTMQILNAGELEFAGSQRFQLRRLTTAQVAFTLAGSGTTVLDVESSTGSFEISDGWVHVVISVDLGDPGKRHMYINDVSDLSVSAYVDSASDFTLGGWHVGNRYLSGVPSSYWNGDIADLMVWHGSYIDLSIEANRRLFITSTGKPVNPSVAVGALGNPKIMLSGATSTWHTNDGTGGGFTENGALTDATTSPSD